jgi:hypothetical protein
VERKDWKASEIPVDLGDFGEYQIGIYISHRRQAIGVEFGEKRSEPIVSVYSDKIKYCPYCGKKL